jgi:NADH-quinone oxidoreductase subunit M
MLGIWAVTLQSTQGALMVMINHGISTGALFFLVGMIYERRHSRMVADFGGIARVVPVYAAVLTVVSLSSVGLPGTNGFVGEFLVLLGTFRSHPVAAAIAASGVVFAAAYLLWALQRVIYYALDKKENQSLTDLVPREYGVLVPLIVMIFWLGLAPGPVLRRMEPSARSFIEMMHGRAAPTVAEARTR